MKEKIIELLNKYSILRRVWIEDDESMCAERPPAKEELADELEKLFLREYLNDCIEKAEPNLSKIKDVDRELAEIKGEKQTCNNCKYAKLSFEQYPCSECNWGQHDLKWEPIKTEQK